MINYNVKMRKFKNALNRKKYFLKFVFIIKMII